MKSRLSYVPDQVAFYPWMTVRQVLDYVAAHECAHLKEMNHSAKFWALVARCCPDWQRQRAWLRLHGTELQAAGD